VNINDQQPGSEAHPLKLLLLGATEPELTQCLQLVVDSGFSTIHDNAKDKAAFEQALNQQPWDLALSCHPLESLNIQQIVTKLTAQNANGTLLLLDNEPYGKTSLQALRDGVSNIVSLLHCEHLKLVLQHEIGALDTRRQLTKLQIEKSQPGRQVSPVPPMTKKDLLTGLYNQRYFITGSQQLFKKFPPDAITIHSILFIRLDKIDTIRMQVGVAAADIIIADIASRLRTQISTSYPLARFDDHGFIALLPQTESDKAHSLANTVCNTVSSHTFDIAGADIPQVTCSIGIAITDETTDTVPLLIKNSQMACEGATVAGGNQPHLFNPKNDEQFGLAKEQLWKQKIGLALKENRFKLLFQPIVSLTSNTAENYEILLRMLDDHQEEILPGEFMPLATQVGLMPAIDRWVTHNALNELSKRRRAGKNTSFFIKLDHSTLSDNTFHTWLREQLLASKLPGDALVFEISECSDLKGPEHVVHFIGQLKQLHCRCGLDHFGDNEDSLERMQRLPVDFIKIDRSLIQRICEEPKVKSKIKQLVTSAHDKEQQAIAEFVQDANTLSALWSCDMDYIQGYFLQRPDGTMDYDFTDEN